MTINTAPGAAPFTVDIADIEGSVGQVLGPGPWVTIDQERINAFADATGDHQWIHIDSERARKGPFGRTIAHGYLTLSLVPLLMSDIFDVTGRSSGVNYGVDNVRFVAPVPEGARVRLSGTLLEASPRAGGVQYRLGLTIELEGSERPAAVGEFIALAFP